MYDIKPLLCVHPFFNRIDMLMKKKITTSLSFKRKEVVIFFIDFFSSYFKL